MDGFQIVSVHTHALHCTTSSGGRLNGYSMYILPLVVGQVCAPEHPSLSNTHGWIAMIDDVFSPASLLWCTLFNRTYAKRDSRVSFSSERSDSTDILLYNLRGVYVPLPLAISPDRCLYERGRASWDTQ